MGLRDWRASEFLSYLFTDFGADDFGPLRVNPAMGKRRRSIGQFFVEIQATRWRCGQAKRKTVCVRGGGKPVVRLKVRGLKWALKVGEGCVPEAESEAKRASWLVEERKEAAAVVAVASAEAGKVSVATAADKRSW